MTCSAMEHRNGVMTSGIRAMSPSYWHPMEASARTMAAIAVILVLFILVVLVLRFTSTSIRS